MFERTRLQKMQWSKKFQPRRPLGVSHVHYNYGKVTEAKWLVSGSKYVTEILA